MTESIQSVSEPFRALACTIVPEAAALDESGWREMERIVDTALAQRPAAMRRQLRLFIRLVDTLPLLRYGRPFRRLSLARRTRFLERVERSPLLIIRRGFWGLRTLVFMGYYARPEIARALGYRAGPKGWSAVRSAAPG